MLKQRNVLTNWGMGLNEGQSDFLTEALGKEHEVLFFPPGHLGATLEAELEFPLLVWLSPTVLPEIAALPSTLSGRLEAIPKALLLSRACMAHDLEVALDHGITEILPFPHTRKQVAAVLRRTLEAHALQHTIQCMTKEIMLERELLERKNTILRFMVNFLTECCRCEDVESLLRSVFLNLGDLFPVQAMHAVLRDRTDDWSPVLKLYICAPERSEAMRGWRDLLLEQSCSCGEVAAIEIHQLPLQRPVEVATGASICLPLVCDGEQLGALVLVTGEQKHLGRDQVEALDSAMQCVARRVQTINRLHRALLHDHCLASQATGRMSGLARK